MMAAKQRWHRVRVQWLGLVVILALLAVACGAQDAAAPEDAAVPEDVTTPDETSAPDQEPTAPEEPGDAVVTCEEEREFVWAFITPEGSPYDAGGEAFGAYLEEHAPGCFDFQSFPGGQLGQEQDIEQAIQSGAIQMGVGAFALASFVEQAPLFMTPFVFRDREHTYAVTASDIGEEFARIVEEEAGFKVLGYFTAGDRHILSTRPVRTAEDLQGLTLRVAPSELQINIWRAVGVNPVDLPFGDMYTGLQTGTVEAIELDPGLIMALSLHEVTDYYTLTDHLTGAYPLILDVNFYDSLEPELQAVIDEAGRVAEAANRTRDEEIIDSALQEMEAAGIEIIEFDNSELREQVQSVYDDFPDALPPDLLERILSM